MEMIVRITHQENLRFITGIEDQTHVLRMLIAQAGMKAQAKRCLQITVGLFPIMK